MRKSYKFYLRFRTLTRVDSFKYHGLELHRLSGMKSVVEQLCKQAKRAKTVFDLDTLRHKH